MMWYRRYDGSLYQPTREELKEQVRSSALRHLREEARKVGVSEDRLRQFSQEHGLDI